MKNLKTNNIDYIFLKRVTSVSHLQITLFKIISSIRASITCPLALFFSEALMSRGWMNTETSVPLL